MFGRFPQQTRQRERKNNGDYRCDWGFRLTDSNLPTTVIHTLTGSKFVCEEMNNYMEAGEFLWDMRKVTAIRRDAYPG